MPIYAECDICGKKYRFADDQAGLTVPCKECTADFDVIKPPLIDRKVLIGVGVTIGAMLGLFIVAVVIVEIFSTTRSPTPVAGTPTPAPVLPRSTPVVPSIPNTSPAASVPPSSTTLVPPADASPNDLANLPRRSNRFDLTKAVPPKSSASVSNVPVVIPANPIPPFDQQNPVAPTIRGYQPANVAVNANLTIQGDNLNVVLAARFLSIRDPKHRYVGSTTNRSESEVTFHLSGSLAQPPNDSELFVLAMFCANCYAVTVPKQVVDWKAGQPLPKDYESLVYVPSNERRRIGAGHHLIFVETGASVDLEGTSGQVFLRPGARIESVKDVGLLEIMTDRSDLLVARNIAPSHIRLSQQIVFCVVDDLVRITQP